MKFICFILPWDTWQTIDTIKNVSYRCLRHTIVHCFGAMASNMESSASSSFDPGPGSSSFDPQPGPSSRSDPPDPPGPSARSDPHGPCPELEEDQEYVARHLYSSEVLTMFCLIEAHQRVGYTREMCCILHPTWIVVGNKIMQNPSDTNENNLQ